MKKPKLLLLLILCLAFGLRLYRIDNPVADWHSWRQADTSAVSRNFLKQGFDILHPRFDDLSNIPSGLENPAGYRFVEFPLYNLLQALSFKLLPFWTLEMWGRLVSIFASLLSLTFLYLIVKRYLNERTALLTALFFGVLPFNLYYSRAILPEAMMVAMSLAAISFFERSWLVSAIFGSLAMLVKPFAVFLIGPAWLYLAWHQKPRRFLNWPIYWLIVLLPFFAWRRWMVNFPEGIPANDWLLNTNNIRFKGAFFYWLFGERIGKLILGYWGSGLLALGLVRKPGSKENWFFFSWLLGILAYFFVFAAGNVQHDYYQVLAIPVICVFLAKGADLLLTTSKEFFRPISYLLFAIICLFMLAFSWYYVRDFFNINNEVIVKAGQAVDRLLPPEAKVIAPYAGDTAFLYQTNRQGWPVGIEVRKFIKLGATHYVNVNFGPETDWLMVDHQVLEKTPDYVIIQLQ